MQPTSRIVKGIRYILVYTYIYIYMYINMCIYLFRFSQGVRGSGNHGKSRPAVGPSEAIRAFAEAGDMKSAEEIYRRRHFLSEFVTF